MLVATRWSHHAGKRHGPEGLLSSGTPGARNSWTPSARCPTARWWRSGLEDIGTLANPVKLYKFLDAATNSLTTDEELASLKELAGLANEVRGIGLDNIQFLTVPWKWWVEDPNRVVWAPEADKLWHRLENDMPLPRDLSKGVVTAADGPSAKPRPSGGATPSAGPSQSPAPTPSDEAAAADAAENGLCA